jgi:amino acid transporter
MITKQHSLFFLFWAIYFGAMAFLHIVCLFDISLYGKFVSGAGYYGIGALALTIGFTFMFFKFRNYGRRKT